MNLYFLMERKYAPYSKWFGVAFKKLACGSTLEPILLQIQQASTWPEREASLSRAYMILGDKHNALGITEQVDSAISFFWERPFHVIHAGRFVDAIPKQTKDPEMERLLSRPLIGNVNQWSDNVDVKKIDIQKMKQLYSRRLTAMIFGYMASIQS